jgi:MFS family permease
LGLLATSAVLAIAGLYLLSSATGLTMIFVFATLYGFGKTFFWPTTLGVVSEQCPKGGALTLNAIAGIGMLAVGILGGPVIGKMTEDSIKASVEASTSADTYKLISNDSTYFLGDYTAVDASKVAGLPDTEQEEVKESIQSGKQGSLASVAIFPVFMLACYLALIFYFKGRGGYKPVEI